MLLKRVNKRGNFILFQYHFILTWIVIFLLSGISTFVDSVKVSINSDGFVVYVDNLPMLIHSQVNAAVAIGNGRANFTEDQGNFIIEEDIDEKVELPVFITDSTRLPEQFTAVLSSDTQHPEISVTLIVQELTPESCTFFRTCVNIEVQVSPASVTNRLWFRLASNVTEKIYGGGEQYTYLNLKGHDYPMWTREQGVGRNQSSSLTGVVEAGSPGAGGDYHTTYYPDPIFLSNWNYFVQGLIDTYSVMRFSDPIRNEYYVHGHQLALKIGTADSLIDLVGGINLASSRVPPALPEWIYNGAIVATQGGTQIMLDKIQLCLDHGVNISAVWIQDWAGKIQTSFGYRVFWNWRWNETLYPGLDQAILDLSGRGIQVTAYINPHLNVEGELFKEADSFGYLLKDSTGQQSYRQDFGGFLAGTIDFSNPLARQYYSAEIIQKNLIGLGLKGFMADFGEYTPLDAVALNSLDPYQFHNQLPVLWARTVREALEESGTFNSVLPWARSGYAGAQNFHSMMWAGDQNVDWSNSDGLPSSIVATLSLGLSGFGLSHSDIGGYTTLNAILTRSRELLLRWAEYSAFTPLMRTHEGNKPELNYQIFTDNQTLADFGRLTGIYTTLVEYHKEVVRVLSTQGLPAMRPLFLHYPIDPPEVFDIQHQYLYGPDLLVAPVLQPLVATWTLYLPTDDWVHLWDDAQTVVSGPRWVTVAAPLGKTPVFYRSASKWASLFNTVRTRFNF